jgi:hypothetical protein
VRFEVSLPAKRNILCLRGDDTWFAAKRDISIFPQDDILFSAKSDIMSVAQDDISLAEQGRAYILFAISAR